MLKNTLIASSSGFVLAVMLVLIYNHINADIVATHVDGPTYSLEDLEKSSDLIVKGKMTQKLKNVVNMHEGLPIDFWTTTEFKIQKILKGDFDINKQDKIIIQEPYGTVRNPFGLDILTTGAYLPIKENKSYILFLYQRDGEGKKYDIVGWYQGKHVFTTGETEKDLDIGHLDVNYKNLHKQVLNKYYK